MPLPIPLLLGLGLGLIGGAVVVAYWDDIRSWALSTAEAWVRAHLGPGAADALKEVIVVLDRPISAIRRAVRRRLLVRTPTGRVRVASEETISAEDLPDDLRAQVNQGPVQHTFEV
jgi:hypothetical protein